ncbi:MAG: pyridoxamine 5'-phosphate oxidase family protein [Gaiellaceae bacterium]
MPKSIEPEQEAPAIEREATIAAALEIMIAQTYCAIVTIDSSGRPRVRTMNPFPPESDLTVWMATNSRSRKVQEIRANPQVCLYYADHGAATGSVAIAGKAVLVDEASEKQRRKRDYWSESFPDWKYLLLIKVVPERLEVLNYERGLTNEGDVWRTPSIELESGEGS